MRRLCTACSRLQCTNDAHVERLHFGYGGKKRRVTAVRAGCTWRATQLDILPTIAFNGWHVFAKPSVNIVVCVDRCRLAIAAFNAMALLTKTV